MGTQLRPSLGVPSECEGHGLRVGRIFLGWKQAAFCLCMRNMNGAEAHG
jgi:hypothetical protein